jgi:hypothetical protein
MADAALTEGLRQLASRRHFRSVVTGMLPLPNTAVRRAANACDVRSICSGVTDMALSRTAARSVSSMTSPGSWDNLTQYYGTLRPSAPARGQKVPNLRRRPKTVDLMPETCSASTSGKFTLTTIPGSHSQDSRPFKYPRRNDAPHRTAALDTALVLSGPFCITYPILWSSRQAASSTNVLPLADTSIRRLRDAFGSVRRDLDQPKGAVSSRKIAVLPGRPRWQVLRGLREGSRRHECGRSSRRSCGKAIFLASAPLRAAARSTRHRTRWNERGTRTTSGKPFDRRNGLRGLRARIAPTESQGARVK